MVNGWVGKVAGHLAANFSIHNSLLLLMLKHSLKVGGQLAGIQVGSHEAIWRKSEGYGEFAYLHGNSDGLA